MVETDHYQETLTHKPVLNRFLLLYKVYTSGFFYDLDNDSCEVNATSANFQMYE